MIREPKIHQLYRTFAPETRWLSGRGQLTKIRRSDGCRRKTITTAVEFE